LRKEQVIGKNVQHTNKNIGAFMNKLVGNKDEDENNLKKRIDELEKNMDCKLKNLEWAITHGSGHNDFHSYAKRISSVKAIR
jgi:hypothetical protein